LLLKLIEEKHVVKELRHVNPSDGMLSGMLPAYIVTIKGEEFLEHQGGYVKQKEIAFKNTGSTTMSPTNYHFENVINPIIGNNNIQSFNGQTTSNTSKSTTSPITTKPAIKWILGIISAIIAGIVVWLLTKYFFV